MTTTVAMLPSQTALPLRLVLRHGVRFHAVHKSPAVLSSCVTPSTPHTDCSVSVPPASLRLPMTTPQPSATTLTSSLSSSSSSQRRPFTSSCVRYQTPPTVKADSAEQRAVRLENGAKVKAILECGSLEDLRAQARSVETVFLACVILQRLSSLAKEHAMDPQQVEALIGEDAAFRGVCKMVDDNVTKLSPKAILNTLIAVYDVTTNDLYITKSLATQMIWLLRRLALPMVVQTLQVHLHYHGNSSKPQVAHSVTEQCLDTINRRWVELNSPRDIIYLMYLTHSKAPLPNQGLLDRLEDRALDMVEKASAKELYRVIYLLSRQRHRNTPLIRAAIFHLNKQSLSSLSAVQLTNLAFACSSLSVYDAPLLGKISSELTSGGAASASKVREVTPKLAASLLTSFSRLRWKDEGVLGVLMGVLDGRKQSEREVDTSSSSSSPSSPSTTSSVHQDTESTQIVQTTPPGDLSSLEAADKAGVVLSLAKLGVNTAQSHALVRDITAQADVQSLRELCPLLWLDVVWGRCVLGLADEASVSSVLSPDFLSTLAGSEDSFQSLLVHTKLHNIHSTAICDLHNYQGPMLPHTFPLPDAKTLQRGERKAGEKLLTALINIAPLETYSITNTTVSGAYLIDAEFYVDENGNPKPLSQVTENAADVHRVALKVLDFPDLTLVTSDPTGLHVMAQRHLQAMGYTLIQVKHTDVPSHSKVVDLVTFLQQQIKDALKVKVTPKVKVTGDVVDATRISS